MFTQLRYLSFVIASLFLLFILYSCSETNPKSRIIGKWLGKDESYEFLKDGTVIVVGSVQQYSGNYKFIDNNRLKVDIGGAVGAMVFEVSIDKEGKLSLKEPNGHVTMLITEAMAKKNEEFKAYMKSATTSLKEKQYDKAIEDYSKAIAINPNNANAYIYRGVVYSEKGQYNKAMEDYNKAIDINPNDALAYEQRGAAYHKKGQYDKAIEDYNKAIDINPNDALAYIQRGAAYRKKGQYDKAIEDYNKAITIKPSIGYFGRARTYSLLNNESFACDSLRLAFENADGKGKAQMKEKLDDSDFDKIRNSSCFKKIVSRIKK